MNLHCSKTDFDSIRTFCQTERWIPKLKTRNCNRDTHWKICSVEELKKFIPTAFKGKQVMFNSLLQVHAIGEVQCSVQKSFYFCFDHKLDSMVSFFTFFVFWEKIGIELPPVVNYSRGSRVSKME